jgi:hemolysin III
VFFQFPPCLSPAEELANILTHGIAALASVAAAIWLVTAAMRLGDLPMLIGCAVYAGSLVSVFTMSTLSHAINTPRPRHLFRVLDQACIYLLTAGSCTPFFIRFLLPLGWGWMLLVVWGMALVGVVNKLRGHRVNSVSAWFNVAQGWVPLLAARPLLTSMPPGCVAIVMSSASLYMLGIVFWYFDARCRYFHAVWHMFVVAASACVYAGIAMCVA